MITQSNEDEVKRILEAPDYYSMLNVTEASPVTEIKQKYKLYAKLVHPDRNPAAGASDAFKAIGKALDTLTDEESRLEYKRSLEPASTTSTGPVVIIGPDSIYDINGRLEDELKKNIYTYFQTYHYVKRPSLWQRTRTWIFGRKPEHIFDWGSPNLWNRTKDKINEKRRTSFAKRKYNWKRT